jgi:metal-responsive CopG/Arc/MetJ family transcriptional regulator
MTKTKRSYYLPDKLVKAFDKECEKSGYVREKVVAAAIEHFLEASPTDRHKMFSQLDEFLTKKKA